MADDATNGNGGWMGDVQRALALLIIGLLCVAAFGLVTRLIVSAGVDDVVDLAKIMLAALVNMGLIALGFFFGSSKSKETADAGQQKIVDKLTSTNPPGPPGPVAPVPAALTVPWWTVMTEDERNAVSADLDARVQAFVVLAKAGRASPDDLTYLVGKNLLTAERAAAILAS